MTFIALTPTLSQREREILETVLYFPRPLGEGIQGEGIRVTISLIL